MSKGVLLIAHNNTVDYYSMAAATAERIKKYLDLPVAVITDRAIVQKLNPVFDKTILVEPDKTNNRAGNAWFNKGRHNVYHLTPWRDTVVLDTDYMVNSKQLLQLYELDTDFACHNKTNWLMEGGIMHYLDGKNIPTLWATVFRFTKTDRTKQIFQVMEMVESNYGHYAQIYGFDPNVYRNDYALTIALKVINGHLWRQEDFISWPLNHVGLDVKIHRDTDAEYTLIHTDAATGKSKWIKIRDIDFHVLNKENFLELCK